jgi:nitrilase
VFNIVASAFADRTLKDAIANVDKVALDVIERSPRSVSMVLDPSGSIVGSPISDDEGIVYADIDTAQSVEPKQFHDVVGYYNRFDIFDLRVDRSRRDPARFAEGAEDGASDGGVEGSSDRARVVSFREGASGRRER